MNAMMRAYTINSIINAPFGGHISFSDNGSYSVYTYGYVQVGQYISYKFVTTREYGSDGNPQENNESVQTAGIASGQLDYLLKYADAGLLFADGINGLEIARLSKLKNTRHAIKALEAGGKRIAGLGLLVGFIDVANKGFTKGGWTSLEIDAVLLIGSFNPVTAPIIAPIALTYGVVKFGADLAGYDVIDILDNKIYK